MEQLYDDFHYAKNHIIKRRINNYAQASPETAKRYLTELSMPICEIADCLSLYGAAVFCRSIPCADRTLQDNSGRTAFDLLLQRAEDDRETLKTQPQRLAAYEEALEAVKPT